MKKITVPNPMGNTPGARVYAYGFNSTSSGWMMPWMQDGSYEQYTAGYFQLSAVRGPLSPAEPLFTLTK